MTEEKTQKTQASISEIAYKKIIYHTLRYPTSKVCGVLVGSKNTVQDVYPLFHTPIVNPTFSVALDLIEANLESGRNIIGFYEFIQGSEPRLSSIIENNQNLKNSIFMRVWMNAENEIQIGSALYSFSHPAWSVVEGGLKKGAYRFIVDFDAHFEEIELDFRNQYVL